MKKLILGCLYFFSGFIGLVTIATVRALYPYSYELKSYNIFFDFLSNSHMTLLFWTCILLCVVSGFISWNAVYKDDENSKSKD